MKDRRKFNSKELWLFLVPVLFVVIMMWAVSARKSAFEREQITMMQHAYGMLMYQADGSTKTVYHYHPPMRSITRWESLVFSLKKVFKVR